MAKDAGECNMNDMLLSENLCIVKEECDNNVYIDDKMLICQTTLGEIKQCTVYSVNKVDTSMSSAEMCSDTTNDYVKIEKDIGNDIKIEYDNELFCDLCQAYYVDYCTKCGMLVHILNRNVVSSADDEPRELPKNLLKTVNFFGPFGICALKAIPDNVRFGPFTGVSSSEGSWQLRGGKFIVNKEKSKNIHWMQYIRPAGNKSEQNLLTLQYQNNLYYQSNREILKDQELLVYFGEEYEDSLSTSVEVEFIPSTEENDKDVFACTFCCLGFVSKEYLFKHKNICNNGTNSNFSIKGLTQCQFCKIYLLEKEYSDYHMAYCREENLSRRCPLAPDKPTEETKNRKTRRHRMYKCTKCKYGTKYNGDLKNHSIKHDEVKIYKCAICIRRFKTKPSLKCHMKNLHVFDDSARIKTKAKRSKHNHHSTQDDTRQFKCSICEFRTHYKYKLHQHARSVHLKRTKFKRESCDSKTSRKVHPVIQAGPKNLEVYRYKCVVCDFKTNVISDLTVHIRRTHVEEFDFKCAKCEYQTYHKQELRRHVKSEHHEKLNYTRNCEMCDFKTNHKVTLEEHMRTAHSEEFPFGCASCQYRAKSKRSLRLHVKTKHLEEFSHECTQCAFKTNQKASMRKHIKSKHLAEFDHKCELCDYKTNVKWNLGKHVNSVCNKTVDLRFDHPPL